MRLHGQILSVFLTAIGMVGIGAWLPARRPISARQQVRVPSFVEQTGSMPAPVHESSGVAVSRAHPGIIWTHNDSGDDPVLYALDLTGRESASFRLRSVRAVDWEDIARGPCPAAVGSDGDCLFVGDIGDNEERRRSYEIYVAPEPDPAMVRVGTRTIDGAHRIAFTYPDGSHNSEALAITAGGDLLVITKVRAGATHLFQLAARAVDRALRGDAVLVATLLDTLSIRPSLFLGHTATGAAVSPSDLRLVVRTYTQLYFYTLLPNGRVVVDGLPCMVGGLALVGEGVDFLDDETLVLTSESVENRAGEIHKIRC